jgi:HlyD family secretion protein
MHPTKSRRRRVVAAVVVAVVALGTYAYAVMARPSVEFDPSRVAVVERGDLARSVVATGRIEPISKVEIKSKANGIIKELLVEVNDRVAPGQVLAVLDKDNLEARSREARAALAGAEANLTGARAEYEKNQVEAQGPEVAFARRNLDRAEKLWADGLLSQQALDEARSALDQAEHRQLTARGQLGISRARVAQGEAAVAQARAAVDRAAEELANATIRSPIHGIVLARNVEVGSPVSSILNLGAAATPVMVLGDIGQVFVRGKVDESDIGSVRLEQAARIRVETFKDKQFEGRVTQISPMGVSQDNVVTFEVEVSIDNASGDLLANMTANAEIVLEEHKGTLILPEAAIVYDEKRNAFADVVDPGADRGRQRRQITVGISSGTRTQVVEGLVEGQRVLLQ